jgi:serine/threonine-protein phosphatase 2B catalytic subunit
MLLSLLNICTKEELEEADEGLADTKEASAESAERKRVIKSKILAVGRVSRVFALLRYVFCRTLIP